MGAQSTARATAEQPVEVAIVGGGIIGLVLAAGLLRVGVKVKLFEQARGFREIGAGIAFTANAIRCMEIISPQVPAALRSGGSVATSSGGEVDDHDPNDYLRWIDGYERGREGNAQRLLFKLSAGINGFEGCRRDQFLEALVKTIPDGVIELRKRLESIEEIHSDGRMLLRFDDGTSTEADAVIGCDGVKSTVRRLMFGAEHPSTRPSYSHCTAYRVLLPMDTAVAALGEYKAMNQHNHIGPGANLLHYPVAHNKMINAVAFVRDDGEWADDSKTVAEGSKEDLQRVFGGWCAPVRALVDAFPPTMPRWAIFDLHEHPVPAYSSSRGSSSSGGRVCLAGDAAHASSPHHGAGACQGIEDATCLTVLMEQVVADVKERGRDRGQALAAAFATYDAVRRRRSQWLVASSRRVCDLHQQVEWADDAHVSKAEVCFEEIRDRSLKIWNFDYEGMIRDSLAGYKQRTSLSNGVMKDRSIY